MIEITSSYQPVEWQDKMHGTDWENAWLLGGKGGGKSRAAIEELLACAMEFPGTRWIIGRKTLPSLKDSTWREFITVLPEGLISDYNKADRNVTLQNGSIFMGRPLDEMKKFESIEIAGFLIDEGDEVDQEIYTTLKTRVRQMVTVGGKRVKPRYRGLIVSNPPEEDHWLVDTFFNIKPKGAVVFQSTTFDNAKNLPDGYIDTLKSTYSPDMQQRMIYGQLGKVHKGRPVFPQFARGNFIKAIELDPKLPLYRLIDFGFNHPAWVWAQFYGSQMRVIGEKMGKRLYLDDFIRDHCMPYETQTIGSVSGQLFRAFCDPRGSDESDKGKCLGYDTPMIMHNGSVKMSQDIKVGDNLMAPNSEPRKVISICRGKEPLYRIEPNTGDAFVCNESHLLSLVSCRSGRIHDVSVKRYLERSNWYKNIYKLFRVPVKFKTKKLPIDPYMIGLWLGDGNWNAPVITNIDKPVLDWCWKYAKSLGLSPSIRLDKRTKVPSIKLTWGHAAGGHKKNPIYEECKKFLDGKTKKITQLYLTGDRKQRLRLLAGLVDSDGYRNYTGYEIVTCSTPLKDGILFLCRSLGMCANAYLRPSRENSPHTWRINIVGPCHEVPVLLKRKKCKKRVHNRDHLHTGFKVIPIGEGEYYGFTLNKKEGRFLLGDFTVTHNSSVEVLNDFGIFPVYRRTRIEEGIKALKHFLDTKTVDGDSNFVIHPRCTILIEALRGGYHRLDGEEAPAKDGYYDHLCVAEGTLVNTFNGLKAIEKIEPGEMVLTRMGYQPVTHRLNNGIAQVFKVTVGDSEFEATASHKVYVYGRGWVRVDALRYGDMCVKDSPWLKLWSSTGLNFADILNIKIKACAVIIVLMLTGYVREFTRFIVISGKNTMERLARAITSITSMVTQTTMILQISNVSAQTNTGQNIEKNVRQEEDLRNTYCFWKKLDPSLKNGTEVRLALSGTKNTQPTGQERIEKESQGVVKFVRNLMRPTSSVHKLDSVAMPVSQRLGVPLESTTLKENAWRVRNPFPSINMNPLGLALRSALLFFSRGRVQSISPSRVCPVYDLTVQNDHEYFGNGVLLHNCDALRYGAIHLYKRWKFGDAEKVFGNVSAKVSRHTGYRQEY